MFRRWIRSTVCRKTNPHSRTSYSLDHRLGKWIICERNIQYDCYVTESTYVWRENDKCYTMIESSSERGKYRIDRSHVIAMIDESHPVQYRQYSEDEVHIWSTYQPHRHALDTPDTAIVLEDNFNERDGGVVNIVSDASVHTDVGSAAGAWHIFQDRSHRRRVARPLQLFPFSHSHRMEMETALYALQDASNLLFIHLNNIVQRMDSQSGIETLQREISSPRDTMEPEMDIVLAYKHLISCIEQQERRVHQQWVRGHADRREEDSANITPMEQENIECDEEAEECHQQEHFIQPYTPQPGYRAILKLDGIWITSDIRRHVQHANTAPTLQQYGCIRLNLTMEVYLNINWQAIARIRAKHPIHKVIRTSKMIYGWMPVGHNKVKCNLASSRCALAAMHRMRHSSIFFNVRMQGWRESENKSSGH